MCIQAIWGNFWRVEKHDNRLREFKVFKNDIKVIVKTVRRKTETPRGHSETNNRQHGRTTTLVILRGSAYSKTYVRLTSHCGLFWPFVSISGDQTLSMC